MAQLRIGFYGNSTVKPVHDPRAFINLVAHFLDAKIVNHGVAQGSEERILLDLKRTRGRIDVAVIFHSMPGYTYIPMINRDLNLKNVPRNSDRITQLWHENNLFNHEVTHEQFEKNFFRPEWGIRDRFHTQEEFSRAMTTYKEYFWTPELQKLRYEGAFVQIDNFCLTRVPFTIHSVEPEDYPSWYPEIKSGIVSPELKTPWVPVHNRDPLDTYLENNVTVPENLRLAKTIIRLIKTHANSSSTG